MSELEGHLPLESTQRLFELAEEFTDIAMEAEKHGDTDNAARMKELAMESLAKIMAKTRISN